MSAGMQLNSLGPFTQKDVSCKSLTHLGADLGGINTTHDRPRRSDNAVVCNTDIRYMMFNNPPRVNYLVSLSLPF